MSPLRSLPPNVQTPELLNFELSGNAPMLVYISGVATGLKFTGPDIWGIGGSDKHLCKESQIHGCFVS